MFASIIQAKCIFDLCVTRYFTKYVMALVFFEPQSSIWSHSFQMIFLILCLWLRVALPQFDRFVVFQSSASDDVFGGVASRAEDHIRMAEKLLNDFLGLQIPNVDHIVL